MKAAFFERFHNLPAIVQDTVQEVIQEAPKRALYFADKLNLADPMRREQLIWNLKQPGAIAFFTSIGLHGAVMVGLPFIQPAETSEAQKLPDKPPEFVALTPDQQARIPGLTLTPNLIPGPNSLLTPNNLLGGPLGGSNSPLLGSTSGTPGSLGTPSYDYGSGAGSAVSSAAPNYTYGGDSGLNFGRTTTTYTRTIPNTTPTTNLDKANKTTDEPPAETAKTPTKPMELPCKPGEKVLISADGKSAICASPDAIAAAAAGSPPNVTPQPATGQAATPPGQPTTGAIAAAGGLGNTPILPTTGSQPTAQCPVGQAPLFPVAPPATPTCVNLPIAQANAAMTQQFTGLYANPAIAVKPDQKFARMNEWLEQIRKKSNAELSQVIEASQKRAQKEIALDCTKSGCDGKTATFLIAIAADGSLLNSPAVIDFTADPDLDTQAQAQVWEQLKKLPATKDIQYYQFNVKFKAKPLS